MRILLTTQWFYPEPESSRGLPLARWLKARGHDVTVLTGFPNYPAGKLYPGYKLRVRQWDEVDGVRVLRVPLYPNHDQSALRRIVNYATFAASASAIGMPLTGDVDVAYAMATPPTAGIPPLVNKVFRRVPYLFNVTDLFPEAVLDSGMVRSKAQTAVIRSVVNGVCRAVYGNAAFVTAISRGYRRILIERGLPEEKVVAVFNWVDEEMFHPRPRNEDLARQLGLDSSFTVIYGGNFGPLQGIDTIIRAAKHLEHIPDLKIALVGTGQLDAELRKLAADLDAKNVHFTGRLDASLMPEVYSLADVLLVHLNHSKYLHATIPSKTQVYLAMQKPIVIAQSGDAAEIVAESGGGIVAPPQDPPALAAAIERMYRLSQTERDEMARKGRQYYLDHMSLERGGTEIENLLVRAAREK